MNATKIEVPASLFPTALQALGNVQGWKREIRRGMVLRVGVADMPPERIVARLERHDLSAVTNGEIVRAYRLAADGPNWPPVVGMSATVVYGSDHYPATVVTVSKSGKLIGVREDRAIRVDFNGLSESQVWHFEPDESAAMMEYSLRKNGIWVRVGSRKVYGIRLALGIRQKHDDPHF